MVLRAGLEPARISPHAPQTCAATNYATSAYFSKELLVRRRIRLDRHSLAIIAVRCRSGRVGITVGRDRDRLLACGRGITGYWVLTRRNRRRGRFRGCFV